MDFLEMAKTRYSVRNYVDTKVEVDKLNKILEAGRVAPTGANAQPQRLIVVQQELGLEKLNKAARTYGAPLAIIVCGAKDSAWKRPYDGKNIVEIDATIVTDHMMLEATNLGLGTVWICYFEPNILKQEFNIPENYEALSILAIGYAEGEGLSADRHDKARKPIEATVVYEGY